MKLFIAGIATETDTFVLFPTGEAGFAATLVHSAGRGVGPSTSHSTRH
jgi:microcystin degradation protein MlrC